MKKLQIYSTCSFHLNNFMHGIINKFAQSVYSRGLSLFFLSSHSILLVFMPLLFIL